MNRGTQDDLTGAFMGGMHITINQFGTKKHSIHYYGGQ